jgi:hypothetical protein
MTTPQERMRALRWGSELLAAIQQERELESEFRSEPSRIAQHYPSPDALAVALEGASHETTPNFGITIEEAWILFQKVLVGGTVPPGLRKRTLFTLRHFPLPGAGLLIEHAITTGTLDEWLAYERDSPSS